MELTRGALIFAPQAIPLVPTQMPRSFVRRNNGKPATSNRDVRCRQFRGSESEYLSLLSEQAPGTANAGYSAAIVPALIRYKPFDNVY
jgi:hypothetical protein